MEQCRCKHDEEYLVNLNTLFLELEVVRSVLHLWYIDSLNETPGSLVLGFESFIFSTSTNIQSPR